MGSFIGIFFYIFIGYTVFTNFMLPFKNYEILTTWGKSSGIVIDNYFDNKTLILALINLDRKIDVENGKKRHYEDEKNIFSSEVVSFYNSNNERIDGISKDTYLYNLTKGTFVDVYYNPQNNNEIILYTNYRIYIKPILCYLFNLFILFIFFRIYQSNKRKKQEELNKIKEDTNSFNIENKENENISKDKNV